MIRHQYAALAVAFVLAGCSDTQINTALSSPSGQLFCAIQTAGGGTVVAGLIDAEASAVAPGATPIAIIATGATKATVDADCAKAGAGGIAVSPPANPAAAPQIAVVAAPTA